MPPKQARAVLFAPTETEWKAALKSTQMDARSIRIARLVIVERKAQADVAKELDVTRQWVGHVVGRMLKHLNALRGAPPNWISKTVTLPREDWPKVHALEKAARERLETPPSLKSKRR